MSLHDARARRRAGGHRGSMALAPHLRYDRLRFPRAAPIRLAAMTTRLYAVAFLLLFATGALAQQTAAPPQPVQKASPARLQKAIRSKASPNTAWRTACGFSPCPTRERHHHRAHRLPRRLAPRGLWRERHGAPARAHAVQGVEAPSQREGRVQPRAARAGTAPPRTTAPTTSRPSPPPPTTSTGRSAWKPTAW